MTQPELFDVPVLTICQPWAWAILAGHKTVENRNWATRYTGPLVIHSGASRAWMREGLEFLERRGLRPKREELVMGSLLGVVQLTDCSGVAQHQANPYAFGPICWEMLQPRRFEEPVPYKGQLGIWRVPRALIEQALGGKIS